MSCTLPWIPILARVRYKVLLLVAKSQQGLAPKYLCELMSKPPSACPSRPLRSADRCDLLIPWSRILLYPRIGHGDCGGSCNDSPPAPRSVMLQGILSVSLRSLKILIFTSLSHSFLSFSEAPSIHRSILISILSRSPSSFLVIVQAPCINTGIIIVLYTSPFIYFAKLP